MIRNDRRCDVRNLRLSSHTISSIHFTLYLNDSHLTQSPTRGLVAQLEEHLTGRAMITTSIPDKASADFFIGLDKSLIRRFKNV